MRRVHSLILFASTLTTLAAIAGCEEKKKLHDGWVCPLQDDEKWTCGDTMNGFVCSGGKWVAVPCRGPKGCTGKPTEASCDVTVAKVGDACSSVHWSRSLGASCSEDRKSRLRCPLVGPGERSKAELDVVCRGPKGCTPGGGSSLEESCDRTVVDEGDPCNVRTMRESPYGSCSADGKKHLACSEDHSEGKFAVDMNCHGPKGCAFSPEKKHVVCDRSNAAVDAPCAAKDKFVKTCSPDWMAVVQCNDGKYTLIETCKGKTRCGWKGSDAIDPTCLEPKKAEN